MCSSVIINNNNRIIQNIIEEEYGEGKCYAPSRTEFFNDT